MSVIRVACGAHSRITHRPVPEMQPEILVTRDAKSASVPSAAGQPPDGLRHPGQLRRSSTERHGARYGSLGSDRRIVG